METNLARLAEASLARHGDHPSLFFEGAWHSAGELHERSARVGAGLRRTGVAPGDRVVVIMANCPEVIVVYHALWRIGAVVTPVVFLVTALELRHILADSGAVAVVTTPELAPKVAAAGTITTYVVGGDFAELEADPAGSIVDRDDHELAALLYTGGTTGRSKGVALSHANLSHAGASSRQVSHVQGLTRGIVALPLSHSFGILITVGGLHAPEPVTSVLQRWFEPIEWLRLAVEHRVQVTAVVPSMLAILLGQRLADYDLADLRFIFSGGAPLSAAVGAEFARRVPSATILEGYGCTETGGIIAGTPPMAPRPGTVGRPVPGVTIRIAGPDGADVPTGADGEIVVHGANVMSHYWGGEPLVGGAFATGDIGRLDEDGYLTIVDRIKDVILRGGFNVYPRDVEDALMTHPAVAMAAVVGRPDPRLGEEVVAFVSLTANGAVSADDLITYAKQRVGAHKYPRDIFIVEEIPLTSVGKLDRKRLRATVTG
jgi:long-chain acyl-CoA synthetase